MSLRKKGSISSKSTKAPAPLTTPSKPNKKLNAEELVFQKQIKVLEADAGSMRGRDGVVIIEDLKKLQAEIEEHSSISADGRAILLAELKTLREDTETEDYFEKVLGKVLQYGMLACTIIPLVVTLSGNLRELATRPILSESVLHSSAATPFVAGKRAVVTGGCGSLGLDFATLFAEAGGQVVLGCWGDQLEGLEDAFSGGGADFGSDEGEEFEELSFGGASSGSDNDESGVAEAERARQQRRYSRNAKFKATETHLESLGLLRGSLGGGGGGGGNDGGVSGRGGGKGSSSGGTGGWVEVWPLDLESFASVRDFSTRYYSTFGDKEQQVQGGGGGGGGETGARQKEELTAAGEAAAAAAASLDVLVHAAATKEGCGFTEDGHEAATQVNYLSPFLLNALLLPALEHAAAKASTATTAATTTSTATIATADGGSSLAAAAAGALLPQGSGRVVHLACDAALELPDWLPWPLRRRAPGELPRLDLDELLPWQQQQQQQQRRCVPLVKYASSKLAVVSHARELGRRLKSRAEVRASRFEDDDEDEDDEEGGGLSSSSGSFGKFAVASHVVNPGSLNNAFGRSLSTVPPKPSAKAKLMGYFPPVWVAKKCYAMALEPLVRKVDLGGFFLRPVRQGALATFHVATHPSLLASPAPQAAMAAQAKKKKKPKKSSSSGLYSDTAGKFVGCGRDQAWECGRMAPSLLPPLALDRELAQRLWERTEQVLRPWLAPIDTNNLNSNLESGPTPRLQATAAAIVDELEATPPRSSKGVAPTTTTATTTVPKQLHIQDQEQQQQQKKLEELEVRSTQKAPVKKAQPEQKGQQQVAVGWDEADAEFDDFD